MYIYIYVYIYCISPGIYIYTHTHIQIFRGMVGQETSAPLGLTCEAWMAPNSSVLAAGEVATAVRSALCSGGGFGPFFVGKNDGKLWISPGCFGLNQQNESDFSDFLISFFCTDDLTKSSFVLREGPYGGGPRICSFETPMGDISHVLPRNLESGHCVPWPRDCQFMRPQEITISVWLYFSFFGSCLDPGLDMFG